MRETIRQQAELDVAWLDLTVLLRPDPVDLAKPVALSKADAKIREIERLRANLEIAGLRMIEASNAQLTITVVTRLSVYVTPR